MRAAPRFGARDPASCRRYARLELKSGRVHRAGILVANRGRSDAGAGGVDGGREGGAAGGRGGGAGEGAAHGDAQGVPGIPAAGRGAVRRRHVHGAARRGGGRARAFPAVPGVLRRGGGARGAGAVDAAPGARGARDDGRGAALARVVRAAGARVPVPPRAKGGLHVSHARPVAAGAALGALLPWARGALLHLRARLAILPRQFHLRIRLLPSPNPQ